MSEQSNGFSWFLAGLGLGALIGVLYAPKSGRETREDLINSARDGSEYLRSRGREAAAQVSSYAERGRARVNEYADRGRTQWEDFVQQSRDFVQDKSNRVSAAVQAGKDAYDAAAGRDTHREEPHIVGIPESQA